MRQCMSVSFFYREREYFAIVRHKIISDQGYYSIRIMNNKLDSLLNKNKLDLIKETDGQIEDTPQLVTNESGIIYNAIASEIKRILETNSQGDFEKIRDFRLLTAN